MLDASLIDNLKSVDPDRYRASLFADQTGRNALSVLYAFHAELAKVPELVSEPMLGEIRYQWWRDVIDEIYTGKPVRQHEVSSPLAALIKNSKIPRFWLDKLIDERARDLDPTPFENLDAAQEYCRNTSGVLMEIAAHILDANGKQDGIEIAGEAWGLTGLIRSWRYYHNGMLSNLDYPDLCGLAQSRYRLAQENLGKVPAGIIPAIAYSALIPGYLRIVMANGFDPLGDPVTYPQLRKQWRLMRAAMSGRI